VKGYRHRGLMQTRQVCQGWRRRESDDSRSTTETEPGQASPASTRTLWGWRDGIGDTNTIRVRTLGHQQFESEDESYRGSASPPPAPMGFHWGTRTVRLTDRCWWPSVRTGIRQAVHTAIWRPTAQPAVKWLAS
jgi:hypothetical protein